MKAVILAGGLGTRLAEETVRVPKPMIEIGSKPILWHIMSIYAQHGVDEFVIACGYKGEMIKEYFHHFALRNNDYRIHLRDGSSELLGEKSIDWTVSVVDTGLETMTGGRLRRLQPLLADEPFFLTYGDGVGDIDVTRLLAFHRSHGRKMTVTAVHPASRFGALHMDGDRVARFSEKPQTDTGWINGGFFVCEPEVLELMDGDSTVLEQRPLEILAERDELRAFRHDGFWQPMDTLREKQLLERLWASGNAPWRVKP